MVLGNKQLSCPKVSERPWSMEVEERESGCLSREFWESLWGLNKFLVLMKEQRISWAPNLTCQFLVKDIRGRDRKDHVWAGIWGRGQSLEQPWWQRPQFPWEQGFREQPALTRLHTVLQVSFKANPASSRDHPKSRPTRNVWAGYSCQSVSAIVLLFPQSLG